MNGYPALSCMCPNCAKMFLLKQQMTTVFDIDKDNIDDFLNHKTNRVMCRNCDIEFTFELPIVVFSSEHKFAIRTIPTLNPQKCDKPLKAPWCLVDSGFRFRAVTYQIEAVEKVKIFLDGLDDRMIEYIKLCSFESGDATPFDTYNIVYSHKDDMYYHFYKVDCNDEILNEYKVLISDFEENEFIFKRIPKTKYWDVINRYNIKDFIKNGGNLLCQN